MKCLEKLIRCDIDGDIFRFYMLRSASSPIDDVMQNARVSMAYPVLQSAFFNDYILYSVKI